MKLTWLLPILILNFSVAYAKTPLGSWETVKEDIPRGWQIIVVTSLTFPCVFEQATDQELVCISPDKSRGPSGENEIHIRRDRVHEIRVEKRDGANMLAGAGGGAGLGAILGTLIIPGGRGQAAYALGLGGASLGARHARDTHILRGKVIYRRP